MEILTQEYLKSVLTYDPETGIFTWKKRSLEMYKRKLEYERFNNNYVGKIATTLSKKGFYVIHIFGKTYKAITLAWIYIYGKCPKSCLDYIDNDKTNLKIKNIREITRSDVQRKLYKAHIKNKTNLIGVIKINEKQYRARIQIENKTIELGRFKTPEEANKAYIEAKRMISPEFCML